MCVCFFSWIRLSFVFFLFATLEKKNRVNSNWIEFAWKKWMCVCVLVWFDHTVIDWKKMNKRIKRLCFHFISFHLNSYSYCPSIFNFFFVVVVVVEFRFLLLFECESHSYCVFVCVWIMVSHHQYNIIRFFWLIRGIFYFIFFLFVWKWIFCCDCIVVCGKYFYISNEMDKINIYKKRERERWRFREWDCFFFLHIFRASVFFSTSKNHSFIHSLIHRHIIQIFRECVCIPHTHTQNDNNWPDFFFAMIFGTSQSHFFVIFFIIIILSIS